MLTVLFNSNKKILVLGAGFVAKPCVKYLRRVPTHLITVADVSLERAQKVAGKKSNTQGIIFDVTRQDLLEELIRDHDIVIWYAAWNAILTVPS